MSYANPETKWNADDSKLSIVMNIEDALETAFLSWNIEEVYMLLRAYRRQTLPKFRKKEQESVTEKLDKLSVLLKNYNENKSPETFKRFFLEAEDLFLEISQNLKEAGVYYREGRDASHAVLQR